MHDSPGLSLDSQTSPNLHHAARVRGASDIRLLGTDCLNFVSSDLAAKVRVSHSIDARSSATLVSFLDDSHLDARDRGKYVERRRLDPLSVQ